jgi:hypothetical protein
MATPLSFDVRGGLALAASLASVFLGYLLLGHFVMATPTHAGTLGPTPVGGWYPVVYHLTHSGWSLLLIGWAALAIALGMAGYALAGRIAYRRSSNAASGMAARFAIACLLGGGVDAILVAILLFMGRLWLWWY